MLLIDAYHASFILICNAQFLAETGSGASITLNPAFGFYEISGSHRWTQINTDILENRYSPFG